MNYLETSICNYLNKLGLPVSKNYLTNFITQHPDYPSLTSATDALDVLGISYNAVIADMGNISELTFPLLAHTTTNGGTLHFIKTKRNFTTDIKQKWDGVVLMVAGTTFKNNKENQAAFINEKKQKKQLKLVIVGLVFILLFPFLYHITNYGIIPLILTLLSIVGIGLGVLIYQQEQGIDNSITNTLCKKNEDCNAVVKSKGATLFWGIKWSDIGIIYLTTITLLLNIIAYNISLQRWLTTLMIISSLSLPFTLYSIYYQKQKIKKWCVLCLYTLIVLWLQFALLAYYYFTKDTIVLFELFKTAIAFIVLLCCVAALWLFFVKPFLKEKRSTTFKINNLLRLKNNPQFFVNQLTNQQYISVPKQKNDLQLGNRNALLQFVVACNPHCAPCVDTHFVLEEMLKYTQEHIGLTIHFMAKHTPNDTARGKAINAIYNTIEANNAMGHAAKIEAILHNWFRTNEIEKFTTLNTVNQLNPITTNDISNLQKSDTSGWDKYIEYTPTLLINGYKIPQNYSIKDIVAMILPLINEEELVSKLSNRVV